MGLVTSKVSDPDSVKANFMFGMERAVEVEARLAERSDSTIYRHVPEIEMLIFEFS